MFQNFWTAGPAANSAESLKSTILGSSIGSCHTTVHLGGGALLSKYWKRSRTLSSGSLSSSPSGISEMGDGLTSST